MTTKIISAFPGTGKSHIFKQYPTECLDSDSSLYSWLKDEEGQPIMDVTGNTIRNPLFVSDYIAHIKENIGYVQYIFVSSHEQVRSALVESKLDFTLVYPNENLKSIYLERYKHRGSPQGFIDLIDKFWTLWINECKVQTGCKHIELQSDEFLSDYFNF
jgi:hypothetical protein